MHDETKRTKNREEDQEILELMEMLSRLPEAPVPDEFDLRLRRALKQETAKKKKRRWTRWTAAAACLLICVLSVQMIRGGIGVNLYGHPSVTENAVSSDMAAPYVASVAPKQKDAANEKETLPEEAGEETRGDAGGGSEVPDNSLMENKTSTDETITSEISDGAETPENVSRGEIASESRKAFESDCEHIMGLIAGSVTDNDSELLAEAMNYKNDLQYSQESAGQVLKLYDDLLNEEEQLTWNQVNLTVWSHSIIYRLSDGQRDLLVIVSSLPEGMKVSEVVIDHAQWLFDQIGEKEFTLEDVICESDGSQVKFLVNMDEETRSFVWEEKEL